MGARSASRPTRRCGTRLPHGAGHHRAPARSVDGIGRRHLDAALRARRRAGLRGVVFINPDDGLRYFVDYRDGSGADAGTCYVASGSATTRPAPTARTYAPGLDGRAGERSASGSFLVAAAGNDGSLQGGEAWTNAGGSVTRHGDRRPTASRIDRARRCRRWVPGRCRRQPRPPTGRSPRHASDSARRDRDTATSGAQRPGDRAGATRTTYTSARAAMAGGALTVVATGYAPGRDPSPRASAPQAIAPAAWYANGARRYPEITGKARVGADADRARARLGELLGQRARRLRTDLPVDPQRQAHQGRDGQHLPADREGQGQEDPGHRVSAGSRATRRASYAPLGGDPQGPHRQAGHRPPKIGGKAKVGKRVMAKAEGWTSGHEVPLPVVRRQEGPRAERRRRSCGSPGR